jgi:uncharacterized protein YkwD
MESAMAPRLSLLPLGLCAALAFTPGTASASTCPDADLVVTAATVDRARAAVRCMVDAERTTRGLAPLRSDARLDRAAVLHGIDMLVRDYFAHEAPSPAPNGSSPGDRIAATGYRAWAWGENLAAGFPTPRGAMRGWMASEGHCRNVLHPDVTEIGVGVVVPDGNRPNVHWVQAFGLPEGTNPPQDEGVQDRCPVATLAAGPVPYTPSAGRAVDTAAVGATRSSTTARTKAPTVRVKVRTASRGRVVLSGRASRPAGRTRVRLTIRRGSAKKIVTARLRSTGTFRVVTKAPRGRGSVRVTAKLR